MAALARHLTRSIACLVTGIAAVSACTFPNSPSDQRADGTPSPIANGRPALAEQIDSYFKSSYTDAYRNVRAVLVLQNGRPAAELYYNSDAATTSPVYGVTKSVVSTLIGLAIDDGYIDSVDQTLGELLPSYTDVMSPEVASTSLRSILTMKAGFPEDPPLNEAFEFPTEKWVRHILAEGVTRPGGAFAYSSSGSHLLSAIVAAATGRSTLDYAREKLFDPLGIDCAAATAPVVSTVGWDLPGSQGLAWARDPEGYQIGYGHLSLSAPDMAKIGQLYLAAGKWNGEQIVPADWVYDSTRSHVEIDGGFYGQGSGTGYGYQWWMETASGHSAFSAMGMGGQLIEVVPDLELVVVVSTTEPADLGRQLEFVSLVSDLIVPTVESS